MEKEILRIEGLKVAFENRRKKNLVVDDVNFSIEEGKTLCLVGESGCGKSVTSMSVMNILPKGISRIEAGSIYFEGTDLLRMNEKQMREIRGKEISMIFQEPMTSLNPVMKIGKQLEEALSIHNKLTKQEAYDRSLALLREVKISRPEEIMESYPHNLSGGMRQRVMIAMALLMNPKLLIADEPTTALDVTIQAQIIAILKEMQRKHGTSILLITHDLGVVAEIADFVIVMYAGKVVEECPVYELFFSAKHPYTIALQKSIPHMDNSDRLYSIGGSVPAPGEMPKGCRFCPRCREHMPICAEKEPPEVSVSDQHKVRCWKCIST